MQAEEEKEKRMKKNQQSRILWDTIKHTNICVMQVPGREDRKEKQKTFKYIMANNFPNLMGKQSTHPRSSVNPKWDNTKKSITDTAL